MSESKSLAVAKYMLDKQRAAGDSVTPMQFIKLVYVAHGLMLGAYGRPLISESIQAWQYGPVVPSVYHATKAFRSSSVTSVGPASEHPFDSQEIKAMDTALRLFGNKDGVALSSLTHKDGTPWSLTWSSRGKNGSISNDLIENYYNKMIASKRFDGL
jgi:uncharacterized phage-associated protein